MKTIAMFVAVAAVSLMAAGNTFAAGEGSGGCCAPTAASGAKTCAVNAKCPTTTSCPMNGKDAKCAMRKATTQPAGVVNTKCPMMGGKIDPKNVKPELTREFKGQKVGFCCGGCPAAWDKLSDTEKQAKLDAAK